MLMHCYAVYGQLGHGKEHEYNAKDCELFDTEVLVKNKDGNMAFSIQALKQMLYGDHCKHANQKMTEPTIAAADFSFARLMYAPYSMRHTAVNVAA